MRRLLLVLSVVVVGVLLLSSGVGLNAANPEKSVEVELTALIYKEWDATMKKDIDGQFQDYTADITGFAQASPHLDEGLQLLVDRRKPVVQTEEQYLLMELLNPRFKVYGDVAVAAYNFVGILKSKDGQLIPLNAKSTRVYVKQAGRWKLVHYHFTDAQPTRIH